MNVRISISTLISYLPVVGVLLLVATWPFPYGNIQRVILYFTGVAYIADYICNRRWQQWHWNKRKYVYVVFILFSCLVPIWSICDPIHTPLLERTWESYSPFLIIGICGILGITDKFRMEYMAIVMLVVGVFIVGYLVCSTGFKFDDFFAWTFHFNKIRAKCINSHMVVNLYWNIAIILAIFTLSHRRDFPIGVRVGIMISMIPVFFALLITEGRTGLLTMLVVGFLFLVYYFIHHRNQKWILLLMGLFIVCAWAILDNNERIMEARTHRNPRIYIWKVAVETIKDKPIFGYGVCSARHEFIERGLNDTEFRQHYADFYCSSEAVVKHQASINLMHPHNVLLETWMQFGIIGVLIWIACCILPWCMRLDEYQLYVDMCVLTFAIQACFESLGTHLQPLYLCLPVLLYHYQYVAERESKQHADGMN